MSVIGYRKKGENGPLYNPERDYAYITPTLMRLAIENLDAPELKAAREADNITEHEIVRVAEALAAAQQDFVNSSDPVRSFDDALRRHGFYNFRDAVRRFLFASIGEVFCAAWFTAVREVSVVGEESPAGEDMARFSATVREFAARHGMQPYVAEHMAEHMKMWNNVLQTRINELGQQVQKLTQELDKQRKIAATPCCQKKPATFWEFMEDQVNRITKGNKCQSTGCTKTPRSSGPS
jgi:hypothetical protein